MRYGLCPSGSCSQCGRRSSLRCLPESPQSGQSAGCCRWQSPLTKGHLERGGPFRLPFRRSLDWKLPAIRLGEPWMNAVIGRRSGCVCDSRAYRNGDRSGSNRAPALENCHAVEVSRLRRGPGSGSRGNHHHGLSGASWTRLGRSPPCTEVSTDLHDNPMHCRTPGAVADDPQRPRSVTYCDRTLLASAPSLALSPVRAPPSGTAKAHVQ